MTVASDETGELSGRCRLDGLAAGMARERSNRRCYYWASRAYRLAWRPAAGRVGIVHLGAEDKTTPRWVHEG